MNEFECKEERIREDQTGNSGYPAVPIIASGKNNALLCLTEETTKDKIMSILKEMGYHLSVAPSPAAAVAAMKLNLYDLVLLDGDYPDPGAAGQDALEYIESLPGGLRRQMFVGLVGAQYATGDRMAAFFKSVNITIHEKNIDDLGAVLKSAYEDKELLYHLYREASAKYGRS